MPRVLACLLTAFASAFCALFAASASAQSPPPLFTVGRPSVAAVGGAGTASLPPMAARQRVVTVDLARIAPSSTPAPALAVALFDGDVVTVDFVRIEVRRPDSFTWYGRVRDYDRGDVVITVVDGFVAGGIGLASSRSGEARAYQLESLADGTQVLQELDPARTPPEHPPGWTGELPADTRLDRPDATAAADSGGTIDLLVVYSDQTAAAAGLAIGATLQYAVDRANLSYTNSGIATQLRLVYSGPAGYSESGDFATDLDRLQAAGDGYLDNVHALRDTYAADVVSLVIESNVYCGIGYVNSTAASAFTVVNRGCSGGNLSLAHEIGHNFGARHDPYVDATTTPYAYGHGYVYKPGMWRTVMAYDSECNASGFSCSRLPYFSNPGVTNGGAPMGTAATSNNARVHNERAVTVANFRAAGTVGAPSASTAQATAIGANGATLNGTVGSNGASTTVTFQYGPTTGYGTTVTAGASPLPAGAGATAVSAAIAGLASCTTYHFRVVAASSGGTTNGADAAFTTGGCAGAPIVATLAPSALGAGTVFNGTVTSNGAATTVIFEFGTAGFGDLVPAAQGTLPAGATDHAVSATLFGLACATRYQYRVRATNGVGTTTGSGVTFTTPACAAGAVSTTSLDSTANPAVAGTAVTVMATVTGNAPTGAVQFTIDDTAPAGCAAVPLTGSGNTRTASCTLPPLAAGVHPLDAQYVGDGANLPSHSPVALPQAMVAAGALVGTVITNPYGAMQVTGGTLVGSALTIASGNAVLQLGGIAGGALAAEIDFAGLHLAPGNTLTIRSGAANQILVLRNTNGDASAFAGTIVAQGSNGAPPPELRIQNPNGIALGATADVRSTGGLALDALRTTTSGGHVTNAGNADGGAFLVVYGMTIKGGGAYRGDEIDLITPGIVNNPVAGAHYLGNSLQLYPSTGLATRVTVNAYGASPQFINLAVHGTAVLWMPSAWPPGWLLQPNSAPLPAGFVRAPGGGEPAYGGGSLIVQSTGAMTLYRDGANDFAFPGGIALKAGGTLNLNGVTLNQGWTTTGKAFQGIYLEAPQIVSATPVQILSNDLNWSNFSVPPSGSFRVFRLKAQPDGTASYAPADADAPHRNTYSVLIDAAANLQCWTCLVDFTAINVQ